MADIYEKWRGISGTANNRVIQYLVENALSDNDALDLAELASPPDYDNLPRTDARIREVDKKAFTTREFDPTNFPGEFIEEQDVTVPDGTYYVDVIYSAQNAASGTKPQDGKWATFSFEQSLETARVRQARYGTTRFTSSPVGPAEPNPTDGTVRPFEGINVNKNSYDGADIRLPIGSYAYQFFPKQTDINDAYLDVVQALVGTVNSQPFENRDVGEILFVSATGRRRANQNDWEFNYKFEYRANVVDEVLDVGAGQPIKYTKEGHDYLWVYYVEEKRTQDGNVSPILVPKQVNVEQVYPRDDLFTKLFVNLKP